MSRAIGDDAAAVARAYQAGSTGLTTTAAKLAIDRQAAVLLLDGWDADELLELAELFRTTSGDPQTFGSWVARRRPRVWWMPGE